MKLRWLGHASFLLTTDSGKRIVTDPFNEKAGYPIPYETADIVTSSHDHFDHNYFAGVKGQFVKINKTGVFEGGDIQGFASKHDKEGGRLRGDNIIFVFDYDGIRVCHLGDLGHLLDDDTVKKLGRVDVLLVPVGGNYTIDAQEAANIVEILKPQVVVPMHYRTPHSFSEIAPVEPFIALLHDYAVVRTGREVELGITGAKKALIMEYM